MSAFVRLGAVVIAGCAALGLSACNDEAKEKRATTADPGGRAITAPATAAANGTTPSPTASGAATRPAGTPTSTAKSTGTPGGECAQDQISLKVDYPAGHKDVLLVVGTNTGAAACVLPGWPQVYAGGTAGRDVEHGNDYQYPFQTLKPGGTAYAAFHPAPPAPGGGSEIADIQVAVEANKAGQTGKRLPVHALDKPSGELFVNADAVMGGWYPTTAAAIAAK